MEKVHIVIQFHQNGWLKPNNVMNTKLKQKANNNFQNFFKSMNNAVFGKTIGNVRKYRNIKLVTI